MNVSFSLLSALSLQIVTTLLIMLRKNNGTNLFGFSLVNTQCLNRADVKPAICLASVTTQVEEVTSLSNQSTRSLQISKGERV